MSNVKNKVTVLLMAGILLAVSLWCWLKPAADFSESERRVLAQMPEFSKETVENGEFMTDFETYTLDQFPLRDTFRGVKSFSELYLFGKAQVNDLYLQDGYVIKEEYPLSQPMIDNAGKKFQFLYDKYMADKEVNVFLSVVPDKNYFGMQEGVQLGMDYDALEESLTSQMPYAKYIDIFEDLSLEDYYLTDTHWKQENLLPIAQKLAETMGAELETEYTVNTLTEDFEGVYYGQLAMPVKKDTLKYLTNPTLDACTVTGFNTGMPVVSPMYDVTKADSRDPYEMFVCGNDPLVIIENPNAATDKELIVFRDSFGSSIAPLLATGYSKVTLVDIRYIQSGMLGGFLKMKNQDVLFLYSTLVLNSSTSFK